MGNLTKILEKKNSQKGRTTNQILLSQYTGLLVSRWMILLLIFNVSHSSSFQSSAETVLASYPTIDSICIGENQPWRNTRWYIKN